MQKEKQLIERLNAIIEDLVAYQKKRLLKTGERFVPNLTLDDIMQPCDFPVLETDPIFRYEEGVLEGILTVKTLLQRCLKEEN